MWFKKKDFELPPMEDEWNQAEIDAEQARILREATYANVADALQKGKEETKKSSK